MKLELLRLSRYKKAPGWKKWTCNLAETSESLDKSLEYCF